MNLNRAQASALATALARDIARDDVNVAVFPPALWLADVSAELDGSSIAVGAQNCWTAEKGAYTGEIAPGMRADLIQVKRIDGQAVVRAVWREGLRVA